MSTTLKEWLVKTIAELEEERDATPGAVNEDAANALAAMKIALASLEAEPVAYIFKHPAGRLFWSLTDESNKGQSDVMPVYTAQPAPVFVPDELTREEYKRRFMEDDDFDDTFRGGWKAHRAAMLQGDENAESLHAVKAAPLLNSSAKGVELQQANFQAKADGTCPDGRVACSERMPDNDDFVYIWPRPDFGVELHVAQYVKFDKRDKGWYAQVYEQNYGIEYHPITVTHWMPLPAAPQQ